MQGLHSLKAEYSSLAELRAYVADVMVRWTFLDEEKPSNEARFILGDANYVKTQF